MSSPKSQSRGGDHTEPKASAPETRSTHIPLSKMGKLVKRSGGWLWDGVLFDRNSISNPILLILNNKAGREIRALIELEETENCSHAPCVCGQIRSFTLEAARS